VIAICAFDYFGCDGAELAEARAQIAVLHETAALREDRIRKLEKLTAAQEATVQAAASSSSRRNSMISTAQSAATTTDNVNGYACLYLDADTQGWHRSARHLRVQIL
jgi:hypothetical protein